MLPHFLINTSITRGSYILCGAIPESYFLMKRNSSCVRLPLCPHMCPLKGVARPHETTLIRVLGYPGVSNARDGRPPTTRPQPPHNNLLIIGSNKKFFLLFNNPVTSLYGYYCHHPCPYVPSFWSYHNPSYNHLVSQSFILRPYLPSLLSTVEDTTWTPNPKQDTHLLRRS